MTTTTAPWRCPDCGEEQKPAFPVRCTCPTMIYVPPGQHIHHECPRHGKVRIGGGSLVSWNPR